MSKKCTIDDIAHLAGVSKATVSRVLNHKPDVDAKTRERILRIVEEQGFVPSITASGLAGGRSRLIGVLIPSFTWKFIPEVMRGIAEAVGKTPYELVLYSVNEKTREQSQIEVLDRILATKLTSGLLAVFPGSPVQQLGKLHRHDFPVVVIDDQDVPSNAPWVGTDNLIGAYTIVRHLVSLGHRRIAHIQGPMKYLNSRERYQGYCRALQEAGLSVDPALVLEGNFNPSGGRTCANQLFSLPPEQRPDAIFTANDETAYGVLTTAEEFGIQIPREIALAGFDDIEPSSHVRPALTTIRQPFYEMGWYATQLLLAILDMPRYPVLGYDGRSWRAQASPVITVPEPHTLTGEGESLRIHLATNLVVRSSCGSAQPFTMPTVPLARTAS